MKKDMPLSGVMIENQPSVKHPKLPFSDRLGQFHFSEKENL